MALRNQGIENQEMEGIARAPTALMHFDLSGLPSIPLPPMVLEPQAVLEGDISSQPDLPSNDDLFLLLSDFNPSMQTNGASAYGQPTSIDETKW